MNKLQRATVNSLASVTGYLAPILVNLVATPILLNRLGPDAFGVQNLSNAIMGYFFVLEAGMTFAMIRYLAEDRARSDEDGVRALVRSGLGAFTAIGLLGMVIIILSADFFAGYVFKVPAELRSAATLTFAIAGVGFFAGMIAFWGRAVASGLQRYELHHGVTVVSTVIGTALGIVLIYFFDYGVVAFVGAKVLVSLVACGFYIYAVRHLIGRFAWRAGIDKPAIRRLAGYARFGILGRINGVVYLWLDNTLIALWLGTAALAAYVPPFTIMNLAIYFIGSILSFVMPLASEYYHLQREHEFRNLLLTGTRLVAALTTLIFVQLFVLGDSFFTLWLGDAFAAEGTALVRLLAFSGFVGTTSMAVVTNVLPVTGHMRQFTTYSTVRSVVFAIGCVLLIRPVGIEGAGLALVVAACVDLVFALIAYPRYLHLPMSEIIRAAYMRPLLLGLPLALAAWLGMPFTSTWLGFIAVTAAISAGYILIGFKVGVFQDTERRALQGLWRLATQRFALS
jgi:O-antigen/teichoic acid export membrane protein